MLLTGVGMGFGLLLDVLLAARLGTGIAADTLIVALTLPLTVDTIARMSITFSLVPVFVKSRSEAGEAQHACFVSAVLNGALLLGLVLGLIMLLGAPVLVAILAPGLPAEARPEASLLLRICSPMLPAAFGIALLAVQHNSERRFIPVAARSLVAPSMVVATLVLAWNSEHVTRWMAGAYSVGYVTFFLVLLGIASRSGMRYRWALPRSPDLRMMSAAVGYPTVAYAVRQGAHVVERTIASFTGAGGVASLYFAFRIFSAVQTIVGYSAATTGLPAMSELGRLDQKAALAASLRARVLRVGMVTVPIAIVLVAAHDPIVSLLYRRGAFDANAARHVSDTLMWLGMSLPFFCVIPVLQAGLHAQQRFDLVLRNVLVVTLCGLLLAWLLAELRGVPGIAMGISLGAVISVANLVYLLRRTGVHLVATGS